MKTAGPLCVAMMPIFCVFISADFVDCALAHTAREIMINALITKRNPDFLLMALSSLHWFSVWVSSHNLVEDLFTSNKN
jgi:hypothetical protein